MALLMGFLPASADLSRDFPSAGQQGEQSSRVAWAVSYALKTFQERRERGWSLDDPAHLFSPSFT